MTQGADLSRYNINVEPLIRGLAKVDFNNLVEHPAPWFNQTICQVNDCVVRLGIIEGDFHWHHHDDEDEFFYVISGHLQVDVEGQDSIELFPGTGTLVPRAVVHRPRAVKKTVMLMFEGAGVVPTGD